MFSFQPALHIIMTLQVIFLGDFIHTMERIKLSFLYKKTRCKIQSSHNLYLTPDFYVFLDKIFLFTENITIYG